VLAKATLCQREKQPLFCNLFSPAVTGAVKLRLLYGGKATFLDIAQGCVG
jgi:hypothetical protein